MLRLVLLLWGRLLVLPLLRWRRHLLLHLLILHVCQVRGGAPSSTAGRSGCLRSRARSGLVCRRRPFCAQRQCQQHLLLTRLCRLLRQLRQHCGWRQLCPACRACGLLLQCGLHRLQRGHQQLAPLGQVQQMAAGRDLHGGGALVVSCG